MFLMLSPFLSLSLLLQFNFIQVALLSLSSLSGASATPRFPMLKKLRSWQQAVDAFKHYFKNQFLFAFVILALNHSSLSISRNGERWVVTIYITIYLMTSRGVIIISLTLSSRFFRSNCAFWFFPLLWSLALPRILHNPYVDVLVTMSSLRRQLWYFLSSLCRKCPWLSA